MDYRNERDALRARVENLEQEFDEARRARQGDDAARVGQLEEQLAEALGALQDARRELAGDKGAQALSRPPDEEVQAARCVRVADHLVQDVAPTSPLKVAIAMVAATSTIIFFVGLGMVSTTPLNAQGLPDPRIAAPRMVGAVRVTALGAAALALTCVCGAVLVAVRRRRMGLPARSGLLAPIPFLPGLTAQLIGVQMLVTMTAHAERDISALFHAITITWLGFAGVVVGFLVNAARPPR